MLSSETPQPHWTTFDYAGLDFSGASLDGKKASVMFVNPMIVNVPSQWVYS
jgi:hypothetical protein